MTKWQKILYWLGLSVPGERRIWAVWLAGTLSTLGGIKLLQDWYGLEGWVAQLQENWRPAWITVPLSAIFIAVSLAIVLTAIRNKWDMGNPGSGRKSSKRPVDPQPDDYCDGPDPVYSAEDDRDWD